MRCYICGNPATSMEHAPARCFFPKGEINGELTKVPSCTIHNEDTSLDDEYVRNVVAMIIGNNAVALTHFLEKCIRSFERSPKLFQRITGVNQRVFVHDGKSNDLKPTYSFQIERNRIDFVMRKIAYAIYFHKHNSIWSRELAIGTEFLITDKLEQDAYGRLIKLGKEKLGQINFEGTNPEVFQFAFLDTDSTDPYDKLLVMRFYEGFEVWAFAQPNTTAPKLNYEN